MVLTMVRGNDLDIERWVSDGAGNPLNLDGQSLIFLAKASRADADAAALITKTSGTGITHATPQATAGNTGKVTITIVPADTTTPAGIPAGQTTTLFYELRHINGVRVTTLEMGELVIEAEVVRAIA
jgi:hypothetical protein